MCCLTPLCFFCMCRYFFSFSVKGWTKPTFCFQEGSHPFHSSGGPSERHAGGLKSGHRQGGAPFSLLTEDKSKENRFFGHLTQSCLQRCLILEPLLQPNIYTVRMFLPVSLISETFCSQSRRKHHSMCNHLLIQNQWLKSEFTYLTTLLWAVYDKEKTKTKKTETHYHKCV